MPAGLPKIDIQFLLNADGILKVQATELRSGTQQSITIQPQYGLTDQAVETMLLSAMQNAASDMQNRSLTESINEAKQVVYQCQKLLKNNAQLLSAEEVSATQAAITELEQLCEGSDKEAIIQATERLNTISRPFAERLMDNAIATALTGKSLDQIP
jgi:molecular chaperone HscA